MFISRDNPRKDYTIKWTTLENIPEERDLGINMTEYLKWKKKDNDQELIQSHSTSHPQNPKGKNHSHKWYTLTKDTHRKPFEQLFPQ